MEIPVEQKPVRVLPRDYDLLLRGFQAHQARTRELEGLKQVLEVTKPDQQNRLVAARAKLIQRRAAQSVKPTTEPQPPAETTKVETEEKKVGIVRSTVAELKERSESPAEVEWAKAFAARPDVEKAMWKRFSPSLRQAARELWIHESTNTPLTEPDRLAASAIQQQTAGLREEERTRGGGSILALADDPKGYLAPAQTRRHVALVKQDEKTNSIYEMIEAACDRNYDVLRPFIDLISVDTGQREELNGLPISVILTIRQHLANEVMDAACIGPVVVGFNRQYNQNLSDFLESDVHYDIEDVPAEKSRPGEPPLPDVGMQQIAVRRGGEQRRTVPAPVRAREYDRPPVAQKVPRPRPEKQRKPRAAMGVVQREMEKNKRLRLSRLEEEKQAEGESTRIGTLFDRKMREAGLRTELRKIRSEQGLPVSKSEEDQERQMREPELRAKLRRLQGLPAEKKEKSTLFGIRKPRVPAARQAPSRAEEEEEESSRQPESEEEEEEEEETQESEEEGFEEIELTPPEE